MIRKRMSACITVALLAVLPSCDSEGDPPRSAATPSGPTLSPDTDRCPNAAGLVASGSRLGGELTGDVTGDGRQDAVYLVRNEIAPSGCRDLLVVETDSGTATTPLVEPGREPSLPQPRLNALAMIDTRPGAEILVDLEQGASTQFVGMFTFDGRALTKVRFEGDKGPPDLFPYGGSVGHIEASDCGEQEGSVVVSVATPLRDRYEVRRTVYRFGGPRLVPDESASERIVVTARRLQRLPEFTTSPFGMCPQPEPGADA